jgi:hypothetical protein
MLKASAPPPEKSLTADFCTPCSRGKLVLEIQIHYLRIRGALGLDQRSPSAAAVLVREDRAVQAPRRRVGALVGGVGGGVSAGSEGTRSGRRGQRAGLGLGLCGCCRVGWGGDRLGGGAAAGVVGGKR